MINKSILGKVAFAFASLILLIMAIGGVGIMEIGRINAQTEAIFRDKWNRVELTREALKYSNLNSRLTVLVFLLKDPKAIETILAQRAANTEKISERLQRLEKTATSAHEKELLTAIKRAREPYISSYLQALDLLLKKHQPELARDKMISQTLPLLITYHATWEDFRNFQGQQVNTAAKESSQHGRTTRWLLLITQAIAMLAAGGIAIAYTRALKREMALRQQSETSLRRAQHELEERVEERTRQLQRSEESYRRQFLDNFSVMLMINPADGRIFDANAAAADFYGYPREQLMTMRIADFNLLPQEAVLQSMAIVKPEHGQRFEFRHCRADGTIRDVEVFSSLILFGDRPALHSIIHDITDRKEAAAELLEKNRQLKVTTARANAMTEQAKMASIAKSEFLANMSHEIRTPMNGVIGMTGLLLDTQLTETQRHYAETVRTSGQTLLQLINDILDLSKIEAGKLELEIQDFDLHSLLDDFAGSMAVKAAEKRLEFICARDPEVPIQLRGDPGRLRQVLTNLTGNAIKFTQNGEVVVRVFLESQREGEAYLRFTVRDTGIGIPPDKQDLLFEKFSQVDASTTRQFGGTGLGLAISKQLVEIMGGRIGFSSEAGKGSEFWFTTRLSTQPEPKPEPAAAAALRGVRVLVVDDNTTNREILQVQLAATGMVPTEAADGPSALRYLYESLEKGEPFGLAILDMQMPGMDGAMLGRAIRADTRLNKTVLVMMTSLGQHGDPREFKEIGFAAYLWKPVRWSELFNCLVTVLGGDSQRQAAKPTEVSSLPAPRFRGGVRILIAEDNITNQQVAAGLLDKLGLKADAVANGREAIQALATIPYDLVLMDVQMPEMDGLAATRQIRQQEKKRSGQPAGITGNQGIPIIAMTAHALASDRERCLEAGMNDYISKPVDAEALTTMLAKWLPEAPPHLPMESSPARVQPEVRTVKTVEAASLAVFDRASFLARMMDDERLVREVQKSFLEELPKNIERLQQLVARGETKQAGEMAHGIKGAAANVDGKALCQVATDMEMAGKQGDQKKLEALMPELAKQFQWLKVAMEAGNTAT